MDAYELGVRLQHMLRRLTALAAGASVQVRRHALYRQLAALAWRREWCAVRADALYCCWRRLQAPLLVCPGVHLGNAVAADSHHLLQHLGVTHVINAAKVKPQTSRAADQIAA